jgi:hypothetical protein
MVSQRLVPVVTSFPGVTTAPDGEKTRPDSTPDYDRLALLV